MMKRRLLLSTLIALLALPAIPAAAQGGASMTITPATALEDGDLVTVTGSGFEADSQVFLLLCNDDTRLGDTIGRCALIGSGSDGYTVDATGSFNAVDVAVPVGQVGATSLATCPPSAAQLARGISCSIQIANADLAQVAVASIGYFGQADAAAVAAAAAEAAAELARTGPLQESLAWVGLLLIVAGSTALFSSWRVEDHRPIPIP